MGTKESIDYLREKVNTNIEFYLICKIVDYAEGMNKEDQFDFLWGMLESLNIDNDILEGLEF